MIQLTSAVRTAALLENPIQMSQFFPVTSKSLSLLVTVLSGNMKLDADCSFQLLVYEKKFQVCYSDSVFNPFGFFRQQQAFHNLTSKDDCCVIKIFEKSIFRDMLFKGLEKSLERICVCKTSFIMHT